MAKPLFGVETEYALAGIRRDGTASPPTSVVRSLMLAARRRLAHLPDGSGNDGIFLVNGSRFYVDAGLHPELAIGECVDPWQAVQYIEAGHRILASLISSMPDGGLSTAEIICFRSNVDLSGGETTWACHESYLHTRPAYELRNQMIPHLVTRIIYTGAGGFDPFSPGLEFTLAPRMAFFDSVVSNSSTDGRGIWHTKSEPLCEGYGRLHVLCGESLCSQTANFLKVGVTALILAMADAGLEPGRPVRLADAVKALRTVTGDVTCKAKLRMVGGGELTAVEVQRHYLALAENHLRDDFMPAWAPDVCRQWRIVLDLLDNGPACIAQTLDWGIKYALYSAHARTLNLRWSALAVLNETIERLPADLSHPSGAEGTIRDPLQFLLPDSESRASAHRYKSRDEVEAVLRGHGLGFADLSAVLDSRPQFLELETRFGQLGGKGIFQSLDAAGALTHRIDGIGDIEQAMTEPPVGSRAFLRGHTVRRLAGNRSASGAWQQVVDFGERKILDLSDPFAQKESWQPLPPDSSPAHFPHPQSTRESALDAYLSGDYSGAEELLRECLRENFELHSTYTHLARVLLLLDRVEEARDQIVRAWRIPTPAPHYVVGRILFFECLFAMLDGLSVSTPVGRLRDLLCECPAHLDWTIHPMLDHVHRCLAEKDYNFLATLADALSDRQALHRLNDLLQWRDTEPDRGWYRRYRAGAASGTASSVQIANQDPGQNADQSHINSDDIPF
jgi:proteasome accessory factor A